MKISVSHIMFLPHESITVKITIGNNHHLIRLSTRNNPNTNRKHTIAPIYTGPEVNGCAPQYNGNWFSFSILSTSGAPREVSFLAVSLSEPKLAVLAPPLKSGINRVIVSSIP